MKTVTPGELLRLALLVKRGHVEVVRHDGSVALLAVLKPERPR